MRNPGVRNVSGDVDDDDIEQPTNQISWRKCSLDDIALARCFQDVNLCKQFGKIVSLNLASNNISALPQELPLFFVSLQDLNLSANQLVSVRLLSRMETLRNLDVSKNRIEEVDALTELKQLRVLKLHGNRISRLPRDIDSLACLEVFQLGSDLGLGNALENLPDALVNITTLTHLNVSNNLLQFMPERLGTLSSLKSLVISNNQLRSLPASIGSLQKLTSLDLSKNRLTHVPSTFACLKSLCLADLSHNKIAYLSDAIVRFLRFKSYVLIGNPLEMSAVLREEHEFPPIKKTSENSLMELAARALIKSHGPVDSLPAHLVGYLCETKESCSVCRDVCLRDYHVKLSPDSRMGYPQMPCKYVLCSSKCLQLCSAISNTLQLNDW